MKIFAGMIVPLFIIFLSFTFFFKLNADVWLQEGVDGGKVSGCPELQYCRSYTQDYNCCTEEEQSKEYFGDLFNVMLVGACISYLGAKFLIEGHENF